jgi:hypothetical protein
MLDPRYQLPSGLRQPFLSGAHATDRSFSLQSTLAPLVVEAQQAGRSIGLAISATLAARTIHSTSLSAKVYVSWATTRGATSSLNAEVHQGSPTDTPT